MDVVTAFPDVSLADEDGLLALGGDLDPESLVLAYSQGIFPWPMLGPRQKLALKPGQKGVPLTWFSPPQRAVLFFAELHIPRSLAKTLKTSRDRWTTTWNQDFASVIETCARIPRTGQAGTWIVPEMPAAYIELHRRGIAHSLEVWDEQSRLIAGIYGVEAAGIFSAESMFHREDGASKFAVLELCARLQAQGKSFLDIQVMTPHLKLMGAREIPRAEFIALLRTS